MPDQPTTPPARTATEEKLLPPHEEPPPHQPRHHRWLIPLVLVGSVAVIAIAGTGFHHHAASTVNQVALSQSPKPVTIVPAQTANYQAVHRFVGTLRPWIEARVGPQFISAYVNSVLVRPGATVTTHQVLATLDCRDASARSHAVDLQARAMQAQQTALASQAQRTTRLLDGGFVAMNDVEIQTAQSNAQLAQTEAERARLVDTQLSVSDCILRAPFDGDIGERWMDPGAFAHPGDPIVSVIDRSVVRLVVDVPEDDFDAVAPGTTVGIEMLALKRQFTATISRRSPSADPTTRTVHVEIDLPDPEKTIPVNTTAEIHVGIGKPVPAIELPLIAADIAQAKAKVFVVENGVARAHTVPVLGESGPSFFVKPDALPANAEVVTEGRGGLADKDRVDAKESETADGGAIVAGPEVSHD